MGELLACARLARPIRRHESKRRRPRRRRRSTPLLHRIEEYLYRQMSDIFESSRAPEPVGAFPHAKRVGNLIFLSGIGPRTRGAKEIPGGMFDSAPNAVGCGIGRQL